MKVFLAGTANGSKWRDQVIERLKIDFFNPMAEEMTEERFKQIQQEREDCNFLLYVITPRMTEFDPVMEVVDDSNKRPEKTIFYYMSKEDDYEFSRHQNKSLVAIGKMVKRNGGKWFEEFDDLVDFLNSQAN